jgi:hypothetical protein
MNYIWAVYATNKNGERYFVASYPSQAEALQASREEHTRKRGVTIQRLDPPALAGFEVE